MSGTRIKKSFVIDTSVLIHEPNCIESFGGNYVVIPIVVIEELEALKSTLFGARDAIRRLEEIAKRGDIYEGVQLNGSDSPCVRIHIIPTERLIPKGFNLKLHDNHILSVALALKEEQERQPSKNQRKKNRSQVLERTDIILISKDAALRLKAKAVRVTAQDYQADKVRKTLYLGYREWDVSDNKISELYRTSARESVYCLEDDKEPPLHPNEFVHVKGSTEKKSALCVADHEGNGIRVIRAFDDKSRGVQGQHPKNRLQKFALHALTDRSIPLITMTGKAGTGKTFLALAAGLYQLGNREDEYRRIFVGRNPIPVGRDIGYLPGTVEEKLTPWMGSIYDNLETLLGKEEPKDGIPQDVVKDLMEREQINLLPLLHLRGRTINNAFIIIDEAQNLTPHEVKTIVTRAGINSKLVVIGDPHQIDNPYLDFESNGLTYLVDRMQDQAIAAHINLEEGERSELSKVAAEVL